MKNFPFFIFAIASAIAVSPTLRAQASEITVATPDQNNSHGIAEILREVSARIKQLGGLKPGHLVKFDELVTPLLEGKSLDEVETQVGRIGQGVTRYDYRSHPRTPYVLYRFDQSAFQLMPDRSLKAQDAFNLKLYLNNSDVVVRAEAQASSSK